MPREKGFMFWTWRLPLIVAVTAMLIAAALASLDQRPASDAVVVIGFAVGMLSIPLWMITGRKEKAR